MKKTTIYLTEYQIKKLKEIKITTGKSPSYIIRELIDSILEDE